MFCENPHINTPFGYSPVSKNTQKQFVVRMAIPASEVLFLFFLSTLLVPSSEAYLFKDVEERQIFYYEAIQHDVVFPSTPVTVTVSPNNSAPAIITIPSTNPVPVPNTNPANPPAPVTTPSTKPGGQPVSNPVTTYPSPTGVGVPVTNPVTPPAATNAPATTGKSWCVAKTGAQQSSLQAALDYACGIGKADCSAIQQGATCYNPNTLQNHASYAFNSYYQKNPVQTSCDFAGTAAITNVNPSVGSCIFPTSSSSSSPPTTVSPVSATPPPTTSSSVSATPPPPTTSSPVSGTPTPPTTASPSGTPPSTSTPPSVLNSSSPTLGGFPTSFGDSPPPVFDTSTSASSSLQPFIGCLTAAAFIITGKFILDYQDLAF
ncbi:glucan endo-1,3-beta-glucosidase 3-like isoform X1 [Olea europaea var. sylvestris]|uniref:glucan endo-1,3-beta-glucosidase 3-like isoform X1 n=1 Tax=Olea europaea var. sylvestris TaxID=158386 RepID=UPI000C1D73C4|nr:glucan endo-1,3-beta-glucosidase 3-like isoform X1 [Olea europaea var. sylvestris]